MDKNAGIFWVHRQDALKSLISHKNLNLFLVMFISFAPEPSMSITGISEEKRNSSKNVMFSISVEQMTEDTLNKNNN